MPIHNLARLIILSEKTHILLAQNIKKGVFFLPGGHIEIGERLVDASLRELAEETGIAAERARDITPLKVYEYCWNDNGTPYHEIGVLCLCTIDGISHEKPIISCEKELSFSWYPLKSLHEINLLPYEFRDKLPKWINTKNTDNNFYESLFKPHS